MQTAAGLDATHLPFAFDAQAGAHGRLLAHVARDHPLWRECEDGHPVMVMFQGGDAYVSPNWYPTHEARTAQPKPRKMSDSKPADIDQRLRNIVGLDIEIERIVGASKLSQNKEARDRQGVAEAMQAAGGRLPARDAGGCCRS